MKRWFLLAATALGMATGCDHGPSQDACTQLLDHLVDLEFKKAGTTATDESQKADLAKQKAGVIESKSPEFMAACTDKTAKERVDCALAASDLDAVAKCDETN